MKHAREDISEFVYFIHTMKTLLIRSMLSEARRSYPCFFVKKQVLQSKSKTMALIKIATGAAAQEAIR